MVRLNKKLNVFAKIYILYTCTCTCTHTHTHTRKESVTDYFLLVLAGLAGSPRMVAATIMALARLVYEFHGEEEL